MIERLGSDYKVMKGAVTPDHEMKSDDDTAPDSTTYRSTLVSFVSRMLSSLLPHVSRSSTTSSEPKAVA